MSAASPRDEDVLARAVRALAPPPAPPAVARVLARLHDEPARARWAGPLGWGRPTRVALAAVAAFAVIVGLLVAETVRVTRRREEADRGPPLVARVLEGAPRAFRGDRAIRVEEATRGDAVRAEGTARVELAGGTVAALDAGASLLLEDAREVRVTAGRVRFDTGPRPAGARDPAGGPVRLTVDTRTLTVLDLGTRFGVDVAPEGGLPAGGERVRVTVEQGRVEAGGRILDAGLGQSFLDGRAEGLAWPLDARPTVALEPETTAPRAGEPVVLRVVLRNATGGWISLPEPDLVRAPVWIEVTPPGGPAAPVRVTADLLEAGPAPPTAIPPRGETSIRVRFDRTFASPGTYRLRAIYRPAGAVERPASPEVQLTVR